MGSAGALGMAKVYPELFAAVSIFNHHFAPRYNRQIFGPQGSSQLNIQGPGGDPLFIANLWDLYSPASATQRDLPLMNVWLASMTHNLKVRIRLPGIGSF
jgi:hypothetical protein